MINSINAWIDSTQTKEFEIKWTYFSSLVGQCNAIVDQKNFSEMAKQIKERNGVFSTIRNLFWNVVDTVVWRRVLTPLYQAVKTVAYAVLAAAGAIFMTCLLPFAALCDVFNIIAKNDMDSFFVGALKAIGDRVLYIVAAPTIVPIVCGAAFVGGVAMTGVSLVKGAFDSVRNVLEAVVSCCAGDRQYKGDPRCLGTSSSTNPYRKPSGVSTTVPAPTNMPRNPYAPSAPPSDYAIDMNALEAQRASQAGPTPLYPVLDNKGNDITPPPPYTPPSSNVANPAGEPTFDPNAIKMYK